MEMNNEELEIEDVYEDNEIDSIEIEGADLEEERKEKLIWDKKARKLMRQIVTQKVELPISRIRQMIDDKEIDLAPGFQRRLRWTRAQKSRLIESVMMNVPIPPVFLGEQKPGQYVVLDGRQRLTAIYEYLGDRFSLSGLNVLDELNGKKFKKLKDIGDPPISSAITRRFVPAILILHESVPEVKYEVFDRLNTGGVIAEPMEVRNAIYNGEFRVLLHEVANSELFRLLWGIPTDDKQREKNGSYKKMVDLEMALRFFAFQNYEEFTGSMKNFLNEYMSSRNEIYKSDPELKERDKTLFNNTIKRTYDIYGKNAFHRPIDANNRSSFPSAPLADAILYAMSKLPDREFNDEEKKQMRIIIDNLCLENKDFIKSITTGTNARTSAKYRVEETLRRVYSALA
jgi:hypothetical protein